MSKNELKLRVKLAFNVHRIRLLSMKAYHKKCDEEEEEEFHDFSYHF